MERENAEVIKEVVTTCRPVSCAMYSSGSGGSNMAAAPTSVVVLDRGNNTTCTINLHGQFEQIFCLKFLKKIPPFKSLKSANLKKERNWFFITKWTFRFFLSFSSFGSVWFSRLVFFLLYYIEGG